jgi:Transcriptional Coactivator p15 (PC4)
MSFNIGVNRNVIVKTQDGELVVIIEETGTDKRIVFTDKRWVQFLLMTEDIDNAVDQLNARQYVSYQIHIGGKWYVSITTGFMCVNLRQFYMHATLGVRPTKNGIALRIPEWTKLKEVIFEVTKMLPTVEPCYIQDDHQNQEGWLRCIECNPFPAQ